MATITKRGDGQWQTKIRKKGYPLVSNTCDTKAKAERWAKAIASEMDHGASVSRAEAESTTLKEALNRYLNEITPTKKGAHQEVDRVKAWMNHELADWHLASLRSVDFAQYRDQNAAEGASASTIRNHLSTIRNHLSTIRNHLSTIRNHLSIISHLFNVGRKEWGGGLRD